MLQLKNITKQYSAGDEKVEALRGVNIEFRTNEFVSILGPSGCGKTTLLNIVGGLDQYTDGDLIISGKSTKEFNDRDWDSYRNHKVGFVFQSYNLIMHQTVLSNVELALTLSGVSKTERRQRAIEALEKVGLVDQINKKPNQMSGGQMQRVAIARALVNDPEILLADEPTGALDSVTSVQIMELLKEIANDRLVVMVTHNPDLAEAYSTRIIKLLDGQVIDDSNPFQSETNAEHKQRKTLGKQKTSMSFLTALSLSLNNLMTKKARTFLTAFAGSIGIIGIALILSISSGLQSYIDKVQEDTLSSYPVAIQRQEVNFNSLINSLQDVKDKEVTHDMDKIYSNLIMYQMMEALMKTEVVENDLRGFKEYLSHHMNNDAITSVVYGYDVDLHIYSSDLTTIRKLNPSSILKQFQNMSGMNLSGMGLGMDAWSEVMAGKNGEYVNPLVESQYEILDGRWPQAYNEVVLVADKNNEINDFVLCMLGFKTEEELEAIIKAAMRGEEIPVKEESWTYEEILDTTFKLIVPSDYYKYNQTSGTWENMSDNTAYMQMLLQNAETLKIVGIVKPNEDAVATSISGAIGYTYALTEHVVEKVLESDIAKQQIANPDRDVFSGLAFKPDNMLEMTRPEKAEALLEYIATLNTVEKAKLAKSILSSMSSTEINEQVNFIMSQFPDRESLEEMIIEIYSQQADLPIELIKQSLSQMSDEELRESVKMVIAEEIKNQYKANVADQLKDKTDDELCNLLDEKLNSSNTAVLAELYDSYMPSQYSNTSYSAVLSKLGIVDLDDPAYINIYAASFEAKDEIERLIKDFNNQAAEGSQVSYTDYIKLILSSVTKIINAVSYILIAFVSISLVVSSIMIGIITYISVLERVKEIGILRAVGASKKDVSRVFNAETLIIGFASGLFGILVTLLLNIPINIIVKELTDIGGIAVLPTAGAALLILISMGLTLIAGLLPSRIAAKKDPVEALRSE